LIFGTVHSEMMFTTYLTFVTWHIAKWNRKGNKIPLHLPIRSWLDCEKRFLHIEQFAEKIRGFSGASYYILIKDYKDRHFWWHMWCRNNSL